MIPRKIVLLLLLITGMAGGLQAQNAKNLPDKKIHSIVGTWKVQKILSGKNEVAKNPTSGQWIEFRSDGKYVNQAVSLDSGSYRLDENRSVLFLESSIHGDKKKDTPKVIGEWSVEFGEDTMTLQRKGNAKQPHLDKMKYVYVRIAEEADAVN